MNILLVNDQQHATVLAALRCYQQGLDLNGGAPPQDFAEIATNGDQHQPLTAEDIDSLCESINGGALDITHRLTKLLKSGAETPTDEEPLTEDYDDTEGAYNNGYDVAAWEWAQHARRALALIGVAYEPAEIAEADDGEDLPDTNIYVPFARDLTNAADSVEITATLAHLPLPGEVVHGIAFDPGHDDAFDILNRAIRAAREVERVETATDEGGDALDTRRFPSVEGEGA